MGKDLIYVKADLPKMTREEFVALCAENAVVTVQEYAAAARAHPKTVRDAIRRGDLPGRRVGRRYMIPSVEALKALGLTSEPA